MKKIIEQEYLSIAIRDTLHKKLMITSKIKGVPDFLYDAAHNVYSVICHISASEPTDGTQGLKSWHSTHGTGMVSGYDKTPTIEDEKHRLLVVLVSPYLEELVKVYKSWTSTCLLVLKTENGNSIARKKFL